jgi:hypothetical protein
MYSANQTLIRLFLCIHDNTDTTSVDDAPQDILINKNRVEMFSSFTETPKVIREKDAESKPFFFPISHHQF